MPTKVVCPDCGGVIGEFGPGEQPCTCFADPPSRAAESAPEPTTFEKVCISCGKDLHGHRRVKDSRGYTCYQCAKAERKAEKEGKVACKECRKLVKPAGLVAYEGKMICRKCFNDHQETARFKKKVTTEHYETHEKQRLLILIVVAGLLALIVAYSYFTRGH